MSQTIDKNLLDFDDCFPDGIIVDSEGYPLAEVDKIMAAFFEEHNK